MKLAVAGQKRSLNRLAITAERSKRNISWRQDSEVVRCRTRGVTGLRRHVRLVDDIDGRKAPPSRFSEIEFRRRLPIPAEYTTIQFPSYFRSHGGYCLIGISVSLRRNRIDLTQPGRFYYPLASSVGYTGNAISVNAPFEMDGERLAPIDSSFNRWLCSQAAVLTMDLLQDDLFRVFGADAYLALRADKPGARPDWFAHAISKSLGETACWPVRTTTNKKIDYRKASEIVVPVAPVLDRFLSDERYLNASLAGVQEVEALVLESGAKPFTVNSLIRLRCAGQDVKDLKTNINPKEEANYYFNEYDSALKSLDRQKAIATALSELSRGRRLSPQNRKDLRETASTLAADGSLRKAASLFAIDPSIDEESLAQPFERLHPELLDTFIASLCQEFSVHDWILRVTDRVAAGTAADQERELLYRYVLANGGQLQARTFAVVRRSPTVRNHRGEWVKPTDLVSRRIPSFDILEPALNAPARELEDAKAVLERIAPRRVLRGEEILNFASYVAKHHHLAEAFEGVLARSKKLLVPALVGRLSHIPFLQASVGTPRAPADLHLRTPENLSCLDDEDGFVLERNPQLYRLLGSRSTPSSTSLLAALRRWRSIGRGPKRPEIFYSTLVTALGRERVAKSTYSAEEILWVNGEYRAPADVLVGADVPAWFRRVLPVVRSPQSLVGAFAALGAHVNPTEDNWQRFFVAFAEQYGDQPLRRTNEEWRALTQAYRARGPSGLPDGVPETARCLLDQNGNLHTLGDLREARYLEDDFSELSKAARRNGVDISFAELTADTQPFLFHLGLKRLSAVCHPGPPQVTGERPAPGWFRERHRYEPLERLRHPMFASALLTLAARSAQLQLPPEHVVRSRLDRVETIAFAGDIKRSYRVGTFDLTISVEEAVTENRFVVVSAANLYDLDNLLAYGIAELLGATRVEQKRALALIILPLLQCRPEDMGTLLRRQGIPWNTQQAGDEPVPTDEVASEAEDAVEDVVRQITGGLGIGLSAGSTPPNSMVDTVTATVASVAASVGAATSPSPNPLPRIEAVTLTVAQQDGSWSPPPANGSGGGRTWAWSPPSPQRVERDREVGRRGEELVYRQELQRVRDSGHPSPEDVVVWISNADPGADHDIRSVTEDGKPVWIEVKSTAGRDGYFDWSKNEFQKALREGSSYQLWRVYDATSESPVAKCFPDPIALVREGKLRVDLGTLRAVIEPAVSVETGPPTTPAPPSSDMPSVDAEIPEVPPPS